MQQEKHKSVSPFRSLYMGAASYTAEVLVLGHVFDRIKTGMLQWKNFFNIVNRTASQSTIAKHTWNVLQDLWQGRSATILQGPTLEFDYK